MAILKIARMGHPVLHRTADEIDEMTTAIDESLTEVESELGVA